MTWYLSPEQQELLTALGRAAPPGWKPILCYKVVNNYRSFLTNTRQLTELRKRFSARSRSVCATIKSRLALDIPRVTNRYSDKGS